MSNLVQNNINRKILQLPTDGMPLKNMGCSTDNNNTKGILKQNKGVKIN